MTTPQVRELTVLADGIDQAFSHGAEDIGRVKRVFYEFLERRKLTSVKPYPASLCQSGEIFLLLIRLDGEKKLFCLSQNVIADFEGSELKITVNGRDYLAAICELSPGNAAALRIRVPSTAPQPVGIATSFGCGDRLGLATPGHIRAMREYKIVPVLAQQSIREMTRTERTPQQVMDDATWAVFQEGFTGPWGSDADHLKTEEDIRSTIAAGFNGFTLDPSDHINNAADSMDIESLHTAYEKLFDSPEAASEMLMEYTGKEFTAAAGSVRVSIKMGEDEFKRLAVKYLAAVRHTVDGYKLVKKLMAEKPFDFEMSVDETETPTTAAAHYFVVNELRKSGVVLTALAPRFVGEFQKAIDYIGDFGEFRRQLRHHVVLAEHFGPYKISVHSGSDKFSIFPIVGEETVRFHEKTAGTSYLEALRVVARHEPDLFREIVKFALGRFSTDRASYHVTTDINKVPAVDTLPDDQLERLLGENDSRQVLHITFGSTLTAKTDEGRPLFKERMFKVLDQHEEEHYEVVRILFVKHLESFGVQKMQSA